jgi:CRISPR-associated protein Cas5
MNNTKKVDLSFFLEAPELSESGILEIKALTPLSMTASQPGTYYRSQPRPTEEMLYGLLENAMGLHFPENVRKDILEKLRKQAKKELGRGDPRKESSWLKGDHDKESNSGYVSLLQYHLEFETVFVPETLHFDDLWTRHARSSGMEFPGGSRNYDIRLERIMNLAGEDKITIGDRSKHDIRAPEEIPDVMEEDDVHVRALRPQFPQFYQSPTKREYVVPKEPYRVRLQTTENLAEKLQSAIKNPKAPLYLGNSDGWVHLKWKDTVE